MKFTEFGNISGKTLMLLPGTACKWHFSFKYVLDELAENYHIIAVNYDGFYFDYVTPLEDGIAVDDTTVHIIYAKQMGEKYYQRYIKHFRDPDIHEFDMKHEVWLYDDKWHQPVLDCVCWCMEG